MYIVPLSNLPTVQSGSAGETSAQSGGLPFREVMQQAVQSLQESQQAAAQIHTTWPMAIRLTFILL